MPACRLFLHAATRRLTHLHTLLYTALFLRCLQVSTLILLKLQVTVSAVVPNTAASLHRPIEALWLGRCRSHSRSSSRHSASALGHATACLSVFLCLCFSLFVVFSVCERVSAYAACPNLHHRKFIASALLPHTLHLISCACISTRHTFFSLLLDSLLLLLLVLFLH